MAIQLNYKKILGALFLTALFACAPSAQAAIIKPANNLGLSGYWNLDEGKGTTAYSHGSATSTGNATLFNSPAWSQGKLGRALTFGSSNSYASTSLSWPASGSISMWVYPTSYADWISPAGWKKNPAVSTNGYALIDNGGSGAPGRWRAVFRPNIAGAAEASVVALQNDTLNAWQQVSMTWSLSGTTYTIHLYVNGVDQGSATWTGTPGSGGLGSFHFGNSGDYADNYFVGKVDDVRVYERALSTAEIAAFYNRSAGTRYNSGIQSGTNGSTLNQGLVARWTFDGADMTDKIYDRVGNNNGYFYNGATSTAKVAGKLGQALKFNGSNSYVNAGMASTIGNKTNNLTVSSWIKPAMLSGVMRIVGPSRTTSPDGFAFGTNGTGLRFTTYNVKDYNSNTGLLTAGKWAQVVAVMDSSNNVSFYVNGILVQTVSGTSPGTANSNDPLYIGSADLSGSLSEQFNGAIDDVRIYSRALSANEIKQLYQEGSSVVNAPATTLQNGTTLGSGLVGYWSFNGPDVTDKVYDRSGQGNNGYFYNGATSTAKAQGKLGQALSFDGTDDTVVVPTTFGISTASFSIASWVKVNSTSDAGAFVKIGGTSPNTGFAVGVGSGTYDSAGNKLILLYEGARWIDTGVSLGTGWHYVSMVVNGSGYPTAYLDGVQVYSDTSGTGSAPASSITYLGGYSNPGDRYPRAVLDEVRIYNRALSASEVTQLYTLGR